MYKKDFQLKQRQTIKEYIAYAFQEMLKTISFDDITVQEICSACNISRTTFYRNFSDKYDLLIWIYTTEIEQIGKRTDDCRQQLVDIFYFMKENQRYFKQALLNDPHNTLENHIFKLSVEGVANYIAMRWKCETLPEELIRSIEFGAAGAVYTWKKWLLTGSEESPEHLADKIIADYPEAVRNIFFV